MRTRDAVRSGLLACLDPAARDWFEAAEEQVGRDPEAVRTLFPAIGRRCGRGPLDRDWTVDDAARALLIAALPPDRTASEVADLYRYGDAAEKRGVLRALDVLDLGEEALPLVRDALRTNDTRLVAAALGPYAAAHLDPPAYRQAVLKCVFTGVPLAGVAGLAERTDAELVRMFTDYAAERVAAGRPVPPDVWLVTDREED
jgi:hypothetical protein